ncbi:hypothetical protein RIR_jg25779.t1 [Rhizophagus irregularis DAOM 181602=DAOM 197198]|nr:hypothetical protein RIR_jg25779.t1 [Rhizophagus irregularis DAOM 181602=DAOM 197198]
MELLNSFTSAYEILSTIFGLINSISVQLCLIQKKDELEEVFVMGVQITASCKKSHTYEVLLNKTQFSKLL